MSSFTSFCVMIERRYFTSALFPRFHTKFRGLLHLNTQNASFRAIIPWFYLIFQGISFSGAPQSPQVQLQALQFLRYTTDYISQSSARLVIIEIQIAAVLLLQRENDATGALASFIDCTATASSFNQLQRRILRGIAPIEKCLFWSIVNDLFA